MKRIEDVCVLRSSQFSEDQGPMAHPIRPDSYIAMDNFYTATVYEKGAEIIRIFYTLLGKSRIKTILTALEPYTRTPNVLPSMIMFTVFFICNIMYLI